MEDENGAIQMVARQKDANFSLGVKTATPELSLHVRDGALSGRSTANTNCDVVLEGTTNTGIQFFSGTQTQLRFGDAASTAAGAVIYQHSDDQFKLNYSTSGTLTMNTGAGVVAFKADGNGYIHQAAQPVYHAYGNASSGSIESGDNGVPLGFDSESSFSRGITDSNSRSRFTVPVAGIYYIHCTIGGSLTTSSQAGDGVELEFKKNGSTFPASSHFPAETFGSESGQEWSLNATILMDLAANDYVEAVLENIGSTTANWGHRYFIMYKIM